MASTREAYVQAAASVAVLLRDPAVAAAWEKPSALAEFRVSGLAGHLARQVLSTREVLALPVPEESPISLMDHYGRSQWIDAGVHSEVNAAVRRHGEEIAVGGPISLADGVDAAMRMLPGALAAEPADRVVALPWASWSLTLDDFLVTRILEIAVHADDLAVSTGIQTPEFAEPVFDMAVMPLVRLSARRHGQPAVLRALSRAERAPGTIAAI